MISVFELGRDALAHSRTQVGYREDGAVLLVAGGEPAAVEQPRCVHFHPGKDEAAPLERLAELRQRGLPVHGLSPGWVRRHGLLPVDSLALYTGALQGPAGAAAEGWEQCLGLGLPFVASLTYGPGDPERALLERLERLTAASSVLLLPRASGDRMLAEATTDGLQDVRFLAQARKALPATVRVRASWAALGWKMAQATLAFGVDELAGWGLEEELAYGNKRHSAMQVGAAEVREGIEEAGREPVPM